VNLPDFGCVHIKINGRSSFSDGDVNTAKQAPSIRTNALNFPLASTTAIFFQYFYFLGFASRGVDHFFGNFQGDLMFMSVSLAFSCVVRRITLCEEVRAVLEGFLGTFFLEKWPQSRPRPVTVEAAFARQVREDVPHCLRCFLPPRGREPCHDLLPARSSARHLKDRYPQRPEILARSMNRRRAAEAPNIPLTASA